MLIEQSSLEDDLDAALEDAGSVGCGRNLAERGDVRPCGWVAEVRMVQHIECFQPKRRARLSWIGKTREICASKCSDFGPTEGVPADVPVGAKGRAAVSRGRSAPGGLPDLLKGTRIQVLAIGFASSLLEFHFGIRIHARYEVRDGRCPRRSASCPGPR